MPLIARTSTGKPLVIVVAVLALLLLLLNLQSPRVGRELPNDLQRNSQHAQNSDVAPPNEWAKRTSRTPSEQAPDRVDYSQSDVENAIQDGAVLLGQEVTIGPILFLKDLSDHENEWAGKIITLVSVTNSDVVIGIMRMRYDTGKGYYVPTVLSQLEEPVSALQFPPITVSAALEKVQLRAQEDCHSWEATEGLFFSGMSLNPIYEIVCGDEGNPLVYHVDALDGAIAKRKPSVAGGESHRVTADND